MDYAVHGWGFTLYGGPSDGPRVQVSLYRNEGQALASAAWLRFFDEGQAIPTNYAEDGIIRLHAPMSALDGVLTMLRLTSGAVSIDYVNGAAMLNYNSMASN